MPNYPYYNNSYTPLYAPYMPSQTNPNNLSTNQLQGSQNVNNGIIWVQGEAGAKSYLVGSGNSVLLMDSEQSRFYIKSTDNSGMPMPLRIFEYSEVTNNVDKKVNVINSDYVTHEELEKRLKELEVKPTVKKEVKDNAKSSV